MIEELKDAMRQAKITPPANIETDGEIHWFHTYGGRDNPPTGWYLAYTEPWRGFFGCSGCDVSRSWIKIGYLPLRYVGEGRCLCEEHYNPEFDCEPPCEPPCVTLSSICG